MTSAPPPRRAISVPEWESHAPLADAQLSFLDSLVAMDATQLRDSNYSAPAEEKLSYYDFFQAAEHDHLLTLQRAAKGPYEEQIAKLETQVAQLKSARQLVSHVLSVLGDVEVMQKDASQRATSLHELCTLLQRQLSDLSSLQTALSQRLRYFDTPDTLSGYDEALAFLDSHPHYLEARSTAAKLRVMKSKMMAHVRDGILRQLKRYAEGHAKGQPRAPRVRIRTEDEAERSNSVSSNEPVAAAAEDAMADDLGMLVLGAQLKPKIESLEEVYLQDVIAFYREWRCKSLVVPPLQGLSLQQEFSTLVQACREEYEYASSLFRDSPLISVPQLVSSFFMRVSEDVRPSIIRETSVDVLCKFVRYLKESLLGRSLQQNAPGALPLEPIIKQIVQDTQERLLFRAQVLIKDEIRGYVPTDAKAELAYPDILFKTPDAQYGPVVRTVSLLRLLQPCLDVQVFQTISYEALEAACAACVNAAVPPGMDRELFLVRSLFYLRDSFERMHSYAIFTEKTLDMSNLTAHFADLLTGRKSLLLWLTKGLQIRESRSDSRRDLEKETRRACESLVMEWTRLLLDPLLSHIAKATALQKSRNTQSVADNTYLARDQITDLMTRVVGHMEERLPQMFKRLHVFLANSPEVRQMLVAPVRQNACDAFAQMNALLAGHGVESGDRLEWGVLTTEGVELLFKDKEQQAVDTRAKSVSAPQEA
jgi:hypothetical protein